MAGTPRLSPPPGRRRVRKWLVFCAIALVLLLAGLFFTGRELGRVLTRQLEKRLSAEGVFVTWQSSEWVPGSGVRVHDFALYRDMAKQERLALLNHMTLIKEIPGWNRWESVGVNVTDARLTLGNGESETTVEHLGMRLQLQPGRLELVESRCFFQGLRIDAKGVHLHPVAAGNTQATVEPKPTSQSSGMFAHVDLGWLKTARQWMTIQPKKDEPVLTLDFQPSQSGTGRELTAALKGKKFRWFGLDWDFVDAEVKAPGAKEITAMDIERIRVGYGGRTAEMAGDMDPKSWVLRIGKFESGINVLAFARACFPEAAEDLAGFSSTGAWRISGKGEVHLDRPENSRWNGRVELNGDLVYATDGTRMVLNNPGCALRMEKLTATLTGLKAGLWEGDLVAPMAHVRPPSGKAKSRFDAQLKVSDARLESVMRSFGQAEKQPGVIDIDWSGSGGFDLASLTGSGNASLQDAEFFRIPVVGGLSRVLDKMTPGFGRDTSTRGEVTYRITKNVLKLEDLLLDSQQVRLKLDGTVNLNKDRAELAGEARIKGLAGVITSPLRTHSAVEGKGPLGEVQWDVKRMPGSGLIGGAIKSIVDDDDDDDMGKDKRKPAKDQRKPARKMPPHK